MEQQTYLIYHPVHKLIKIGKSACPDQRIKSLERTYKTNLQTLFILPWDCESTLHQVFINYKYGGYAFKSESGHTEWFRYDGRVKTFVDGVLNEGQPYLDKWWLTNIEGFKERCTPSGFNW